VNADDNQFHVRDDSFLSSSSAPLAALAQAISLTKPLHPRGRNKLPTEHVAPASPATQNAGT
jgi:hypothetical protein